VAAGVNFIVYKSSYREYMIRKVVIKMGTELENLMLHLTVSNVECYSTNTFVKLAVCSFLSLKTTETMSTKEERTANSQKRHRSGHTFDMSRTKQKSWSMRETVTATSCGGRRQHVDGSHQSHQGKHRSSEGQEPQGCKRFKTSPDAENHRSSSNNQHPQVQAARRAPNKPSLGRKKSKHSYQKNGRKIATKKNETYTHERRKPRKKSSVRPRTVQNPIALHWSSEEGNYVPLHVEEEILQQVLHYGKKERGMMKDQSRKRIQHIRRHCQRLGVSILQACSLRRHHVLINNPGLLNQHESLGLGSDRDIRAASSAFEDCVSSHLRKNRVRFWTESRQKQMRVSPTPDFLLQEVVMVHWRGETHEVGWVEAKMFYGASTIPPDGRSAVGRILETAEKYHTAFGPGAMVFSYGCGEGLASELKERGVIALDAHGLDLTAMQDLQRQWCATEEGTILP
jgi:hypothetical protein